LYTHLARAAFQLLLFVSTGGSLNAAALMEENNCKRYHDVQRYYPLHACGGEPTGSEEEVRSTASSSSIMLMMMMMMISFMVL